MNDGGPAFPLPAVPPTATQTGQLGGWHHTPFIPANAGMSLRDYFAAAALTGLLSNSHNYNVHKPLSVATSLEMAELAYSQADEMLKYRDEPQSESIK